MSNRGLTEAQKNDILNLWHLGQTRAKIAKSIVRPNGMCFTENTISLHVRDARNAGDSRAVIRRKKPTWIKTPKLSSSASHIQIPIYQPFIWTARCSKFSWGLKSRRGSRAKG